MKINRIIKAAFSIACVMLLMVVTSCGGDNKHSVNLDGVEADDGTHPEIYQRFYGMWMYGAKVSGSNDNEVWADDAWGFLFESGNRGRAYAGNSSWAISWYPQGDVIHTVASETGAKVDLRLKSLTSQAMVVSFVGEESVNYTLNRIAGQ